MTSQLVLSSGGLATWLDYVLFTCETAHSSISWWRHLGCHCGPCYHESGSLRILPGVRCQVVVVSVGADFGWILRGAVSRCTPSTGTCGCCGWDGGWTEGALLTCAPLRALLIFTPCLQCLTEGLQPWRDHAAPSSRWCLSPVSSSERGFRRVLRHFSASVHPDVEAQVAGTPGVPLPGVLPP